MNMMKHRKKATGFIALRFFLCSVLLVSVLCSPAIAAPSSAESPPAKTKSVKPRFKDRRALLKERRDILEKASLATGIPWTLLAAVDQYERTLQLSRKKKPPESVIGITFPKLAWVGMMNPDHEDTNLVSITFFNGVGRDGSGDGVADLNNDADRLAAMAHLIIKKGKTPEDMRIGLWEYYQNTRSVERIEQFAKLYAAFNTLELHEHAFPLPITASYSYQSTWGASRGWGGFRIHEGTDIFAGYGVPVRATCFGVIEVMGWNRYGGWRIGIRDLNNVYHYYAHLSRYEKTLKPGDIVKPGQKIGRIGSSGYGKPGTSGKFPPHLHYGLYRDNGLVDWSFDPYPYLKRWEREDYKKAKTKNK